LRLNWIAADQQSSSLSYKVCYSKSPIVDSHCAGASVAEDFVPTITTSHLTGLDSNSVYHYQVFVRNSAGNVSAYTAGTQQTLADPPQIESQGTKEFTVGVAITSFNFNNTGAGIASCSISPMLTN